MKYFSLIFFFVILCISSGCYSQKGGNDSIYTSCDTFPEFIYGDMAFGSYFMEKLDPVFPEAAKAAEVEGKIYVQFTVEKDSTISDIVVIKGLAGLCDSVAVEVFRQTSGMWKPARKGHETVRFRRIAILPFYDSINGPPEFK